MVVEDANPDIPEELLRAQHGGWLGSNPYYLMLVLGEPAAVDKTTVKIDLDRPAWSQIYKSFLRATGQWYLVRKTDDVIVATMLVWPGEQPYYVAKHVGFTAEPEGPKGETINYGIGKKRRDGHVDRIWVMGNGCVTLGDDVEPISLDLLKAGML